MRKISDGRVHTADEALELKLVDQIGCLCDAIELGDKLANVDRAKVVMHNRGFKPRNTIYSTTPVPAPRTGGPDLRVSAPARWPTPQFLYLWAPGTR